jgi:hypothetical protein
LDGEIRALERRPTFAKAPSWLNFGEERKTIVGMHLSPRSAVAITLLCSSALFGCAGPNTVAASAPRIRFDQLSQREHAEQIMSVSEQPVVVHFKQGQEVPLHFVFDSRLLALVPQDMKLTVSRDFFLLLRADGPPLLSEDGVEFEEQPQNSFMLGFDVKQGAPAALNLRLGVRAEQQ